jgi:hypothetical protein
MVCSGGNDAPHVNAIAGQIFRRPNWRCDGSRASTSCDTRQVVFSCRSTNFGISPLRHKLSLYRLDGPCQSQEIADLPGSLFSSYAQYLPTQYLLSSQPVFSPWTSLFSQESTCTGSPEVNVACTPNESGPFVHPLSQNIEPVRHRPVSLNCNDCSFTGKTALASKQAPGKALGTWRLTPGTWHPHPAPASLPASLHSLRPPFPPFRRPFSGS